MQERNYSNVMSVIKSFLLKEISIHLFYQFMEEISHSNEYTQKWSILVFMTIFPNFGVPLKTLKNPLQPRRTQLSFGRAANLLHHVVLYKMSSMSAVRCSLVQWGSALATTKSASASLKLSMSIIYGAACWWWCAVWGAILPRQRKIP